MNDLIERQAALKEMEELNVASFYELNEHSAETYSEIKAVIENLPAAQPEQRWIPVTKGLPKRGVNILAYIDYCEVIEILSLETDGQGMLYWEDANGDYESLNDVKAWMPLPEPYREEKE